MRKILFLALFTAAAAQSDVVECENGDRYNGKVLLVDEQQVKILNDITGPLSIPRAKVSSITFGDPKPRPAVAGAPPARPAVPQPGQPLQIDPAAVAQVQSQILGDASPEATQMFQEMVRGLMSGKLDLGDIRAKAQTALDELKDLQKELGDDDAAALLGSYAGILENFVKQTPPPASPAPPKAPPAK